MGLDVPPPQPSTPGPQHLVRQMSQEVLVQLAKEVARSYEAQKRYESSSDEDLIRLGLEPQEVASIRSGFFDRALMMGIVGDDRAPNEHGCCFG